MSVFFNTIRHVPQIVGDALSVVYKTITHSTVDDKAQLHKQFCDDLTLKNIAHLFSDRYAENMMSSQEEASFIINKTFLEGMSFEHAAQYFINSVEYLKTKYPEEFPARVQHELPNFLHKLKKLIEIRKYFKWENVETEEELKQKVDSIKEHINNELDVLKDGESFFMPWGWSNRLSGGHSVLVDFKKTNNDLIFAIVNTGSGSKFHEKYFDGTKFKHVPVKYYKVPSDQMTEFRNNVLSRMLETLVLPMRENRKYNKMEPSDLYVTLRNYKWVPKDRESWLEQFWTKGQFSGFCSLRVIMICYYLTFGKHYKDFKLLWQMESLSELMPKAHAGFDSELFIIDRAITNLFNHLRKQKLLQPLSKKEKSHLAKLEEFRITFDNRFSCVSENKPIKTDYLLKDDGKNYEIPELSQVQQMVFESTAAATSSDAVSHSLIKQFLSDKFSIKEYSAANILNSLRIFPELERYNNEFWYWELGINLLNDLGFLFVHPAFLDKKQKLITELIADKKQCESLIAEISEFGNFLFSTIHEDFFNSRTVRFFCSFYGGMIAVWHLSSILDDHFERIGPERLDYYGLGCSDFFFLKNQPAKQSLSFSCLEDEQYKLYSEFLRSIKQPNQEGFFNFEFFKDDKLNVEISKSEYDYLKAVMFKHYRELYDQSDKVCRNLRSDSEELRVDWLYAKDKLPPHMLSLRKLALLGALSMYETTRSDVHEKDKHLSFNTDYYNNRGIIKAGDIREHDFGSFFSDVLKFDNQPFEYKELWNLISYFPDTQNNLHLNYHPNVRDLSIPCIFDNVLRYRTFIDIFNDRKKNQTEEHFILAIYLFFAFGELRNVLEMDPTLGDELIDFWEQQLKFYLEDNEFRMSTQYKIKAISYVCQIYQYVLQHLTVIEEQKYLPRLRDLRQQILNFSHHEWIENESIAELILLYTLLDSFFVEKQLSSVDCALLIKANCRLTNLENKSVPEGWYSFKTLRMTFRSQVMILHKSQLSTFIDTTEGQNALTCILSEKGIAISQSPIWSCIGAWEYSCSVNNKPYTIDIFTGHISCTQFLLNSIDNIIFGNLSKLSFTLSDGKYFTRYKNILLEIVDTEEYERLFFRTINNKRFRLVSLDETELYCFDKNDFHAWVAEDRSEMIICRNITLEAILSVDKQGHFIFCDEPNKKYLYRRLEHTNITLSLNDPKAAFFQEIDGSTQKIYYNAYTDSDGNPFRFCNRKDGKGWVVENFPGYYLSRHQSVHGLRHFHMFLIIENRQLKVQEIILPLFNKGRKLAKKCERFTLQNGNLALQTSTFKNVYLAFLTLKKAITEDDYFTVIRYLQACRCEIRRFNFKEMNLFIQMMEEKSFFESKPKYDPILLSLKIFIACIVFENSDRYPENTGKKMQPNFWKDLLTKKFLSPKLKDIRENYLKRLSGLPPYFRIENLIQPYYLTKFEFVESILPSLIKAHDPNKMFININKDSFVYETNGHSVVLPKEDDRSNIQAMPIFYKRVDNLSNYFVYLYKKSISNSPIERKEVWEYLIESQNNNQELLRLYLYATLIATSNEESIDTNLKDLALKVYNPVKEFYENKLEFFKGDPVALKDFLNKAKCFYEAFCLVYQNNERAVIPLPNAQKVNSFPERTLPTGVPKRNDIPFKENPYLFQALHLFYKDLFFKVTDVDLTEKLYDFNDPVVAVPPTSSKAETGLFPFVDDLQKKELAKLQSDYVEGVKKNRSEMISLKKDLDFTISSLIAMSHKFEQTLKNIDELIIRLKKDVVETANSGHSMDEKSRLEIGSKKTKKLNLEECIDILLKDPLQLTLTANIDESKMKSIHGEIVKILEFEVYSNHIKNILKEITTLKTLKESEKIETQVLYIADLLSQEHHVKNGMKGALAALVFESKMGLILRDYQVSGLKIMLKADSVFIQRIQAAGKTLVWGHLLAFLNADGYHLHVHVSPSHQYENNLIEMRDRSLFLFNQKSYPLLFKENPLYFNKVYLENLVNLLCNAILDKEYLHTTKEILRLIRGKFIKTCYELDVLNYQGADRPHIESCRQLLWMIWRLFRTRGIFNFDEVDESLSFNDELNLPLSFAKSLDKVECELIAKIILEAAYPLGMASDINLKANQILQLNDDQRKALLSRVALALLSDEKWLSYFGLPFANTKEFEVRRQMLLSFLLDKTPAIPDFIQTQSSPNEATPPLQYLILARNMLQDNWLLDAFQACVYENHGIPDGDDPSTAPISIPYVAHWTPLFGSEFSDRFIIMMKTYIAYGVQGLAKEQVKKAIEYLKNLNRFQRAEMEEDGIVDSKTKAELIYDEIAKQMQLEIPLGSLNSSESAVIDDFQQALKTSHRLVVEFLFDYVNTHVLTQVENYDLQVSSNGQNNATMAKKVIGYSACIDNHHIAPYIDMNSSPVEIQPDFGTNGQTIDLILRKCSDVWVVSNKHESLFTEVIGQLPESKSSKVRAIIDAGCHFRGLSNYEVARLINVHLNNADVKGILYFDNLTGRLNCLYRTGKIQVLSSTDHEMIKLETGLTPEELFTYYDQDRTRGTNIRQMADAIAISTIRIKTPLYKLIQADRRMRLLNRSQLVIHTITKEDFNLPLGYVADPKFIGSILRILFLNAIQNRPEENLILCCHKIENRLQQFLLDTFIKKPQWDSSFFKIIHKCFTRQTKIDLIAEFTKKKKSEEMKVFLETYIKALMQKAGLSLSMETLHYSMKQIVLHMLPDLESHIEVDLTNIGTFLNYNRNGTVVQQRKREQQSRYINNQQKEVSALNAQMKSRAGAYQESEITLNQVLQVCNGEIKDPNFLKVNVLLNQIIKLATENLISPNLYMTKNFVLTSTKNQLEFFGLNRKSLYQVMLVFKVLPNNKVRAILCFLSAAEAKAISSQINSIQPLPEGIKYWLLRPQCDLAFPGPFPLKRELLLANKPIKEMFLQTLFLSCNLNQLETPFWRAALKEWLTAKTVDPASRNQLINFFETQIVKPSQMPTYQTSSLKRLLDKINNKS